MIRKTLCSYSAKAPTQQWRGNGGVDAWLVGPFQGLCVMEVLSLEGLKADSPGQ